MYTLHIKKIYLYLYNNYNYHKIHFNISFYLTTITYLSESYCRKPSAVRSTHSRPLLCLLVLCSSCNYSCSRGKRVGSAGSQAGTCKGSSSNKTCTWAQSRSCCKTSTRHMGYLLSCQDGRAGVGCLHQASSCNQSGTLNYVVCDNRDQLYSYIKNVEGIFFKDVCTDEGSLFCTCSMFDLIPEEFLVGLISTEPLFRYGHC